MSDSNRIQKADGVVESTDSSETPKPAGTAHREDPAKVGDLFAGVSRGGSTETVQGFTGTTQQAKDALGTGSYRPYDNSDGIEVKGKTGKPEDLNPSDDTGAVWTGKKNKPVVDFGTGGMTTDPSEDRSALPSAPEEDSEEMPDLSNMTAPEGMSQEEYRNRHSDGDSEGDQEEKEDDGKNPQGLVESGDGETGIREGGDEQTGVEEEKEETGIREGEDVPLPPPANGVSYNNAQIASTADEQVKRRMLAARHEATMQAVTGLLATSPIAIADRVGGAAKGISLVRQMTNAFLDGQLASSAANLLGESFAYVDTWNESAQRVANAYGIHINADNKILEGTAKGKLMLARTRGERRGIASGMVTADTILNNYGKPIEQFDENDLRNFTNDFRNSMQIPLTKLQKDYNARHDGELDVQTGQVIHGDRRDLLSNDERNEAMGAVHYASDVYKQVSERSKNLEKDLRQQSSTMRQQEADRRRVDAENKRQAKQDEIDKQNDNYDKSPPEHKVVYDALGRNVQLGKDGLPMTSEGLTKLENKLTGMIYNDPNGPDSQMWQGILDNVKNKKKVFAQQRAIDPDFEQRRLQGTPEQQEVYSILGDVELNSNGMPVDPTKLTTLQRKLEGMVKNNPTDPRSKVWNQLLKTISDEKQYYHDQHTLDPEFEEMKRRGTPEQNLVYDLIGKTELNPNGVPKDQTKLTTLQKMLEDKLMNEQGNPNIPTWTKLLDAVKAAKQSYRDQRAYDPNIERRYSNASDEEKVVYDILGKNIELNQNGMPLNPSKLTTLERRIKGQLRSIPANDPRAQTLNSVLNKVLAEKKFYSGQSQDERRETNRRPDGTYGGATIQANDFKNALGILGEYDRLNLPEQYRDLPPEKLKGIIPGIENMIADGRNLSYNEALNQAHINRNAMDWDILSKQIESQMKARNMPEWEAMAIQKQLRSELEQEAKARITGQPIENPSKFQRMVRHYSTVFSKKFTEDLNNTISAAHRATDPKEKEMLLERAGHLMDYRYDPIHHQMDSREYQILADKYADGIRDYRTQRKEMGQLYDRLDAMEESEDKHDQSWNSLEGRAVTQDEKDRARDRRTRAQFRLAMKNDPERKRPTNMSPEDYQEEIEHLQQADKDAVKWNQVYTKFKPPQGQQPIDTYMSLHNALKAYGITPDDVEREIEESKLRAEELDLQNITVDDPRQRAEINKQNVLSKYLQLSSMNVFGDFDEQETPRDEEREEEPPGDDEYEDDDYDAFESFDRGYEEDYEDVHHNEDEEEVPAGEVRQPIDEEEVAEEPAEEPEAEDEEPAEEPEAEDEEPAEEPEAEDEEPAEEPEAEDEEPGQPIDDEDDDVFSDFDYGFEDDKEEDLSDDEDEDFSDDDYSDDESLEDDEDENENEDEADVPDEETTDDKPQRAPNVNAKVGELTENLLDDSDDVVNIKKFARSVSQKYKSMDTLSPAFEKCATVLWDGAANPDKTKNINADEILKSIAQLAILKEQEAVLAGKSTGIPTHTLDEGGFVEKLEDIRNQYYDIFDDITDDYYDKLSDVMEPVNSKLGTNFEDPDDMMDYLEDVATDTEKDQIGEESDKIKGLNDTFGSYISDLNNQLRDSVVMIRDNYVPDWADEQRERVERGATAARKRDPKYAGMNKDVRNFLITNGLEPSAVTKALALEAGRMPSMKPRLAKRLSNVAEVSKAKDYDSFREDIISNGFTNNIQFLPKYEYMVKALYDARFPNALDTPSVEELDKMTQTRGESGNNTPKPPSDPTKIRSLIRKPYIQKMNELHFTGKKRDNALLINGLDEVLLMGLDKPYEEAYDDAVRYMIRHGTTVKDGGSRRKVFDPNMKTDFNTMMSMYQSAHKRLYNQSRDPMESEEISNRLQTIREERAEEDAQLMANRRETVEPHFKQFQANTADFKLNSEARDDMNKMFERALLTRDAESFVYDFQMFQNKWGLDKEGYVEKFGINKPQFDKIMHLFHDAWIKVGGKDRAWTYSETSGTNKSKDITPITSDYKQV